jgi:RNA polymerase sigma factor (TIGR02999 family)
VESSIPELMSATDGGDTLAADQLFSTLYAELHRMARRELARQGAPISLGITTLLHEAYLDIAGRNSEAKSFPDRGRFMSYAARVMRGLIIDHARNRCAQKRGGQFEITSISTDAGHHSVDAQELSCISDALDELARVEPGLAEIVDLKFFCGFTFVQIAGMRGISERTVQRNWEKARIYLHDRISADLS